MAGFHAAALVVYGVVVGSQGPLHLTSRIRPGPSKGTIMSTNVEDARWCLVRRRVRNSESLRTEDVVSLESASNDFVASTHTVELKTQPSLGVKLVELQGSTVVNTDGGKLGKAITVVDGLVEGGNAWRRASDFVEVAALGSIEPGDSIVAVSNGCGEVINTEAADYDTTAHAIMAMAQSQDELILVVKRLTRRKRAVVTAVMPDGEEKTVTCYDGENLRMALIRQGLSEVNDSEIERRDYKGRGSSCGGSGVCATCVVSVLDGGSHLTERTKQEKQLLRKVARWRQSCRAKIDISSADGDAKIRIQLAPRSTTR